MVEDFTTYTLLDSGNDCITVNSATSLSIEGTTNDRYSLHSDKGAAHFHGDFEHIVETSGSGTGVCAFWGLSNVVDAVNPHDTKALDDANNTFLYAAWIYSGTLRIYLRECQSGSLATDLYISGAGTFYCEIERDEDTGTYGTLLCRIYSDSARTTLVDTLSLTLRAKDDFRTVYGAWSQYTSAGAFSVTVDNLDLQEVGTIKSYVVAAGNDDGHCVDYNSPYLLAAQIGPGDDRGGITHEGFMRFTDVDIPAGATIVTAKVVFIPAASDFDGGTTPSGTVKGRKVANCPQMTTWGTYGDTVTYPWTTATVTYWPASAAWELGKKADTPDIKTIIQEIVDLDGWASGNAIQIAWRYVANGWLGSAEEGDETSDFRAFYSYEDSTYEQPRLIVEYTVGTAAGNPWYYYRKKRTT